MKKTVLTSIVALMMSTVAATAAETCKTCGSNFKVFFGASAGMQGLNYDTAFSMVTENMGHLFGWGDASDPTSMYNFALKFPKRNTVVGMEAGVRFGEYKSVWNGGVTLSADKTLGKKPGMVLPEKFGETAKTFIPSLAVKDIRVNSDVFAITFDNYIRLNKSMENRVDLVVGVGAADIETNISLFGVGLSLDAHAAVFKAGLEIQLTDVISMTMGTRMYMPIAAQYFDTSYALKGGFKFSF